VFRTAGGRALPRYSTHSNIGCGTRARAPALHSAVVRQGSFDLSCSLRDSALAQDDSSVLLRDLCALCG